MRLAPLALALALACDREPAPGTTVTDAPTIVTPELVAPKLVAPELVAPAPPGSDAWLLAQAPRYLDDPSARRRALVRSLRNPDNIYSRTRLGSYARADLGWDLLPAWNPRVQTVTPALAASLRAAPLALPDAAPLWNGQRPTTMPAWVELGHRVFFDYPLRPEVFAEHAAAHPDVARAVGLHRAPDGSLPGAIAFIDIDGRARIGITCALCHTTLESGALVVGRARRDFDYGAMRLAYHRDTGEPVDPDMARRMASWGPGRADITEDDDEDPVEIPDLWALRSRGALTQAATLRHGDLGDDAPLALAIRQETQILHANRERTRPPRELAYALAMFLYSLTPPTRSEPAITAAVTRGHAIFRGDCQDCHADPDGSGPPAPFADIGTDPALARGAARGTGLYRPAPLVRVAEAAPYLHHGVVPTLADLFDPARLRADYRRGRDPGPVPGHLFGTDLDPDQRADLIAYLQTL